VLSEYRVKRTGFYCQQIPKIKFDTSDDFFVVVCSRTSSFTVRHSIPIVTNNNIYLKYLNRSTRGHCWLVTVDDEVLVFIMELVMINRDQSAEE